MTRWFGSKRALLGLSFLAACAVNAPSLRLGWFGDDFVHRRFILDHLHQPNAPGAWWNMFDGRIDSGVAGGDPHSLFGRLPWWASRDFSFRLLRPLSTASHFLDYLLWPEQPWAMHVHNILLFGTVVLVAGALYWRWMGPGLPVWLATMMFALDDAHSAATGWIAGRNTLLTALFVLLTLGLHDASVRSSARRYPVLAALALLCAHASSEGGITAWAYLLAHALCLDTRPIAQRARALVPLAVVSGVWIALSAGLGYGVRGSGIYVDPRSDPQLFAHAIVERLPGLLQVQLALPPEFAAAWPATLADLALLGSRIYLGIVLLAAVWFARRSALLRFFTLALIGALLPQCATGSFARLLLLSGFAAHGVTATLIGFAAARFRTAGLARLALVPLGAAALFVHGVVPLIAPSRGLQVATAVNQSVLHAASSLPTGSTLRSSTIMVLNFPDYLRSVFIGLYRRELLIGAPPMVEGPASMHVLGVTAFPVLLTRPAVDAIELEPVGGYLLDSTTLLARRPSDHFAVGESFDLGVARVQVMSVTADRRPARIRVQRRNLEDRSLLWVSWNEAQQRFVPIVLPAVGQSMSLVDP